MITSAQRAIQGSRVWGQLMAAACAQSVTPDEMFAIAARYLPDDPVLLRQLLTGCVTVAAEVNLQFFRTERPPMSDELARVLAGLSPDLSTPNDITTAANLMQLWSVAYTDNNPAALRRYVPVVHARVPEVRRQTLAAMMMLHMHGELSQLSQLGRQMLSETFDVAPMRADARAHILAALWAQGGTVGDLRFTRVVFNRLATVRQRVRADVLWICARTVAAGLIPGEHIDESNYGCECDAGREAARWLARAINSVAAGVPGMQEFVRAQYVMYASRDNYTADHLLSAGVAWLARRFMT